jgi:hypothetical protein
MHIESGEGPTLSIAPKPDTAGQWMVRQRILAEMRNEVDTFGLIERGYPAHAETGSETTDSEWDY